MIARFRASYRTFYCHLVGVGYGEPASAARHCPTLSDLALFALKPHCAARPPTSMHPEGPLAEGVRLLRTGVFVSAGPDLPVLTPFRFVPHCSHWRRTQRMAALSRFIGPDPTTYHFVASKADIQERSGIVRAGKSLHIIAGRSRSGE